jgi:hypothetical protein
MLPTLLFRRQTREPAAPNQFFHRGKKRNGYSRGLYGKDKKPHISRKQTGPNGIEPDYRP